MSKRCKCEVCKFSRLVEKSLDGSKDGMRQMIVELYERYMQEMADRDLADAVIESFMEEKTKDGPKAKPAGALH